MKSKKLMIGMMVVLGFLLVAVPLVANATVDAANCQIMRLGYDPRLQGPMVQLRDLSGSKWSGTRQFYLSSELGNKGLATLLTAYSMGKTVWVRIEGDGSAGSLISIIFIND